MTHEVEAKGQWRLAASRNDVTSILRSSASRLMGIARAGTTPAKLGASPSGKAADFDSAIRRFESSRPSQAFRACGDFLRFLWKGRKVSGLRRLKASPRPLSGGLRRFPALFRGPVSDRRFPIFGIFLAPERRLVRAEPRLGSRVKWKTHSPAIAEGGRTIAARR